MIQIVSQPRELLWAWLNTRAHVGWSEDFRAIGLVKNDCLVAVIGYNAFVGRSCFMHSAIDDPTAINRTFVRAMFEYPFLECGIQQLIAPVSSGNTKAMELDKHVGFVEKLRLPGGGCAGEDLVLLTMTPDTCRWIKGRTNDGRKERSTTPAGLCGSSP